MTEAPIMVHARLGLDMFDSKGRMKPSKVMITGRNIHSPNLYYRKGGFNTSVLSFLNTK